MRKGLSEYLLVTAFLALAAAGAVALFGDEIRGALGIGPPPAVPSAAPAVRAQGPRRASAPEPVGAAHSR